MWLESDVSAEMARCKGILPKDQWSEIHPWSPHRSGRRKWRPCSSLISVLVLSKVICLSWGSFIHQVFYTRKQSHNGNKTFWVFTFCTPSSFFLIWTTESVWWLSQAAPCMNMILYNNGNEIIERLGIFIHYFSLWNLGIPFPQSWDYRIC